MSIRKVHVVFKTHLDIGFTDFADSVLKNYLEHFIPAALALAKQANQPGQSKLFVWTVGAYLLDLALGSYPGEQAQALEQAIQNGDITYHALPFTLHCELCSPQLFLAGLGIAKRLDLRFARHTMAAKMTDVPGHSQSIIAPLAQAGVRYLHLGVNAVARMPQVPPLFLWQNQQGQQVMVHYERSYGGLTTLPGHPEALYFLHSQDNAGPPSLQELKTTFANLQSRFPEAQVLASTLDAFAGSLLPLWDSLPVVTGEIGDTWVHGIGSDPKKTASLKSLDRLSLQWDMDGTWQHHPPLPDGRPLRAAFLEQLLLVCEHTWGLDSKKFLTDFINWDRTAFEKARKLPAIPDSDGDRPGYTDLFAFARREFMALAPRGIQWQQRSYTLFEASHQEQRSYLDRAISLLPPILKEQALPALPPDRLPHLTNQGQVTKHTPLFDGQALGINGWQVQLAQGQLHLTSPAGLAIVLPPPVYQQTGLDQYDRLMTHYLYQVQDNRAWAYPDNGKPGAEQSAAPRQDSNHHAGITSANQLGNSLLVQGSFPSLPHQTAGCPQAYSLLVQPQGEGLLLSLQLHTKPANRLPEALFLPFLAPIGSRLLVRKIGQWVDPDTVVPGGNQRVHGMEGFAFVDNKATATSCCLFIDSLDAVLLAIDAPTLLDFDRKGETNQVYVNLYNNLWGTNFKMWYEEDILCRFVLREDVLP